jgi:Protein of unknown function (DUF3467)
MPPNNSPPQFELPPDLETFYVNVARISHSPSELVFDFVRLLPGDTSSKVITRLVMSPVGAKLFFRALGENLARYEAAFGQLSIPNDNGLAKELFRSIQPPDSPPSA